jgi:hypothetical protein
MLRATYKTNGERYLSFSTWKNTSRASTARPMAGNMAWFAAKRAPSPNQTPFAEICVHQHLRPFRAEAVHIASEDSAAWVMSAKKPGGNC